ncbi:hypothetical protein FRC06_006503, partial [Ceratobasidium sp. 370]
MLEDADRTWLGLTAYQQNEKYTPRKEQFMPKDCDAIRGLLTVLRPLHLATEVMSKASVPLLADVITVLNKYYQKSDESLLYRLSVLLHPSMRAHYMKVAEWEKEWIEVAVMLLEETWHKFYRPTAESAYKTSDKPSVDTSFLGITSYMDRMLSSIDTTQQPTESPVDKFIYNTPAFNMVDSKHVPFNPLAWWYGPQEN